MQEFSDIPPDTLSVSLVDGGILVEYLDGRDVFYHGEPRPVEPPHQPAPGKHVHVLVTDASETQGALLYVNEKTTTDEILEQTGVGRVLVAEDSDRMLFPGVSVSRGSLRFEIDVDHDAVDGRVFVFEEDQFEEFSYELVPATETE